jgi:hypothetical protein
VRAMAACRGALCSVLLWQGVFVGAFTVPTGGDDHMEIEVKADGSLKDFASETPMRAPVLAKSVPGVVMQDEAGSIKMGLQKDAALLDETLAERDLMVIELQNKIKDLAARIETAEDGLEDCEVGCEAKCVAKCGNSPAVNIEKATCKPCDCPDGWSPLSSPPSKCEATTCKKRECCEKLGKCTKCDCPNGWNPSSSVPTSCTGTTCKKSECCEKLDSHFSLTEADKDVDRAGEEGC